MNEPEDPKVLARQRVILDVLAGRLTVTQAALELGVSRKTFYEWQERALAAMPPGQLVRARYLVGDTPFDIAAAKSSEALSIAVATGKFTVKELRAAGADHALPDLGDTTQVLRLLGLA